MFYPMMEKDTPQLIREMIVAYVNVYSKNLQCLSLVSQVCFTASGFPSSNLGKPYTTTTPTSHIINSFFRDEFLQLHAGKLSAQDRGYALEKLLAKLARVEFLEVTDSFRVRGEQIDGTIKYDGEHYLVEAKWQEKAASNEPVYQFVGKIESKMYGRGLFVSVHGFSSNVIKTIVAGKAIKTIFVDGEDLVLVLEEHLSFRDMIDKKVKAAQTKGLVYIHPITGAAKQETA